MSLKKLNFLYSIHRDSRIRIVSSPSYMPAVTRYQKKQQQQPQPQPQQEHELEISRNRRRVRITTPSFVEASTRTYKVYSPRNKPKSGSKKTLTEEAAEVLTSLQYADAADSDDAVHAYYAGDDTDTDTDTDNTVSVGCMNPMSAVTVYIYRIAIYNISQTAHYKTAYILYDKNSRLYHVYSILSNQIQHTTNCGHDGGDGVSTPGMRTEFTLPFPNNTIQFTYKSYIEDKITNFIMTMIVPCNDHDYYIQDNIFGIVIHPSEFQKKAFGEESCYYDIEDIVYDESSTETTSGFKAFMLIPSRHFWYWPAASVAAASAANSFYDYHDNRYTPQTIDSVLTILS